MRKRECAVWDCTYGSKLQDDAAGQIKKKKKESTPFTPTREYELARQEGEQSPPDHHRKVKHPRFRTHINAGSRSMPTFRSNCEARRN